jgi:hypothetical protein
MQGPGRNITICHGFETPSKYTKENAKDNPWEKVVGPYEENQGQTRRFM